MSGSTSWVSKDYTLDTNANNNPNFRIRFRTTAGSSYRYAYIDNVQITSTVFQYTISGTVTSSGSGLDGVTMSGLPGNPVTSGGGNYSATVDYGWSGTVTPSKAGYTFAPARRTYTSVAENHTGENYAATLNTYTISGNAGVAGVTMTGLPSTPVSDANGDYSGAVDGGWFGTVVPTKTGYIFSPAQRVYANIAEDHPGDNYIATLNKYTISGYVTELDGNTPVEGVLIDANNNGGSTDTTDADGYYEVMVPYGWSGTTTPIKEGYTFEPNSILYNNVAADEANDYTATLSTFVISGYITESNGITPINDVNVSAENGGGPYTSRYGGGSDITDANGYYKVVVDYNWSGKVTPTKHTYAFKPNKRAYTNVLADQNDQGYAGRLLDFAISGYIHNDCNVPIKGVAVSANNGGNSVTTDPNGYYKVWVPHNWSGTVTPSKAYYTFDPNSNAYAYVLDDVIDQNYTATNIYDLDCNGAIGYGDVYVISINWLNDTAKNICDFNGDKIVNFKDFAEFANVWMEEYEK